jgi:hypothetical protein
MEVVEMAQNGDVGGALPRRMCGTMQVHHRLLERHPAFRIALGDLEHKARARRSQALGTGTLTIPVVVHVIWRDAAEKISASQVASQIAALNRDYRARNADKANVPGAWAGLPTDARVEFVLASKDPGGQSTGGINYVESTEDSFSDDDSVKSSATGGADAWDRDSYLNLWVCNLGGGLLGYAQFPGGPAETDGVVIRYSAFGTEGVAQAPFNLGRTATHEVGHWLNLRHIWGDTEDCSGSDFVDDTPNAQHPNYNKPTFPHVSCDNGPTGDMFMNYMDYVDDDTMVMFTPQQVARMHATLEGPRSKLVRSPR